MAAGSGGFHFEQMPNGWEVGRFTPLSELAGLDHMVSTRRGPDVMAIAGDIGSPAVPVAAALGLREIAWCRQVHGADVLAVESGGFAGDCDGLVTNVASLGLMVRGADCPLILAADAASGAVGAAHASWRGTRSRIAERLVSSLVERFGADPSRLVACICPSAGPCCYEVGDDVRQEMLEHVGPHAEEFFIQRGGAMHLDLWAANADQLVRAGLHAGNVHVAGCCTMCNVDRFPSYRREAAAAGRFVAAIGRP